MEKIDQKDEILDPDEQSVLPLPVGEKVIVHDGDKEFVMEVGEIIRV